MVFCLIKVKRTHILVIRLTHSVSEWRFDDIRLSGISRAQISIVEFLEPKWLLSQNSFLHILFFWTFHKRTSRSRENWPFWQVVLTRRCGLSCDVMSVLNYLLCSTQSLSSFAGCGNGFLGIFQTFSLLFGIPLMINKRSDWPLQSLTRLFLFSSIDLREF